MESMPNAIVSQSRRYEHVHLVSFPGMKCANGFLARRWSSSTSCYLRRGLSERRPRRCRCTTRSRRQRTTVDLPTADGPDSTMTGAWGCVSGPPPSLTDPSYEKSNVSSRALL